MNTEQGSVPVGPLLILKTQIRKYIPKGLGSLLYVIIDGFPVESQDQKSIDPVKANFNRVGQLTVGERGVAVNVKFGLIENLPVGLV